MQFKQPKITSPIPLMASGGKAKKAPIPRVSTPAIDALYYGVPMREDVVSEREPGPRELLAEKLQAQLERFMPPESAKKGARKITGYGYPMGVADITPAGIPLWAYEGGQELARAGEQAGRGEYGEAALSGAMGALNLAPAAPAIGALGKAAGKGAAQQVQRAMMTGEGPLGGVLAGVRPQFATDYHGSPHQWEWEKQRSPLSAISEMNDKDKLFANAKTAIDQWNAAGRPRKNWVQGGDMFKNAQDAIKSLKSAHSSLPSNIYWRGTNNEKELDLLKNGTQINSKNILTGEYEGGMSVSKTPATIWSYGYKYAYPVEGKTVSIGSDGEPVISNAIPKTNKILNATEVLESDKNRIKEINQTMNRLSQETGLPPEIIDWVSSHQ